MLHEGLELYNQTNGACTPEAAGILSSLADVEFEQGHHEKALELCQRSVQMLRDKRHELRIAPGRSMGWIFLAIDDRNAARAAFQESDALARQSCRPNLNSALLT